MSRGLLLLLAMFMVTPTSSCADPAPGSDPPRSHQDAIQAALAHTKRSAEDRARDVLRKPAEVLALTGIAPGMHVADLMAGGGWYTEVLARTVGPEGRVYAHNNKISNGVYGSALRKRLDRAALSNVQPVVRELEELEFPAASLDAAFLVQFYHDTYWMKVDRAAMNRAVFSSLKPGGVYLIIDHSAKPGAGSRDVKSLHRVDEDLVKQEVLAVGFKLVQKSEMLRNAEDDRSKSVFDNSIRGRTDRFLLIFIKPPG